MLTLLYTHKHTLTHCPLEHEAEGETERPMDAPFPKYTSPDSLTLHTAETTERGIGTPVTTCTNPTSVTLQSLSPLFPCMCVWGCVVRETDGLVHIKPQLRHLVYSPTHIQQKKNKKRQAHTTSMVRMGVSHAQSPFSPDAHDEK